MADPLLYRELGMGISHPAALGTGELAKTTAYTILPSDNGTCFTNTGATGGVTFTLPAINAGYAFTFYVVADQSLTVTSAEGDNIVCPNDAAADSIAFSTSGDKVGGCLQVFSNAGGTLWLTTKPCSNAATIST